MEYPSEEKKKINEMCLPTEVFISENFLLNHMGIEYSQNIEYDVWTSRAIRIPNLGRWRYPQ